MILTCPACGTSYVVKDGAIPPAGRQVRCASCKHSWHQVGEQSAAQEQPAPWPVEAPAFDDPPGQPETAATLDQEPPTEPEVAANMPIAGDVAVPFATDGDEAETTAAAAEAPRPAAEFIDWNNASFDSDEEPAPRRKEYLILLGLVLFVAVLAAAAWFLAPREWLARAGLREASADSPLKLMVTSQDRQKLASGNDLVSLSGRVINPTEQTLTVPPLQADLRDGAGKLVYSWRIAPPAPRLPPRGSASFNAAELGVPPNAASLTLRWAS